MTVTSISSRQPVRVEEDQLLVVIGAALDGTLADDGAGGHRVVPRDADSPSPLACIFNAAYRGRPFADLQSLAAVVIDMQLEQLQMDGPAATRYRWLRSEERPSDKQGDDLGPAGTLGQVFLSAGDGSATAVAGDDLDRAIDEAIATGQGVTP